MTKRLTLDGLASTTGESVERLRDWDELGLIVGDGGTYPLDALDRVRLISVAAQRGIAPEAIAVASLQQGDVLTTI